MEAGRIYIIRNGLSRGSDPMQRMFEPLRQTVRSELAAMSTNFRDCQLFEEIYKVDFRNDLQTGPAPVRIFGVGCADRIR